MAISIATPLALRATAELELRSRLSQESLKPEISLQTPFQEKYRDDPVGFVHDCFRWHPNEGPAFYQNDIMQELVDHHRESARGPHGLGKAQPYGLVIDTPNGKRKFGDLAAGDCVFGSDGKPTRINAVFERGSMEVYKVIFNDGSETLCSEDHLWTVRKFDWKTKENVNWETLSLRELVNNKLSRSNGNAQTRKYAIPTAAPLEYPYQWVPVDPYTLGAWLGDGSRNSCRISGNDREVADRIRKAGYFVKERQELTCLQWAVYSLPIGLRKLDVLNCKSREKFIPVGYLENIPEVRKEILRGLLDTDGTVTKEGTISFSSVSHELAYGVAWLSRSLGGMARIHERFNENGIWWNVSLTLPDDKWFYIERKQIRIRPISQKRYLWRWIDYVEYEGTEPVRCISVDASDGLYVANDVIVTHNTALVAWVVLWFALTNDGVTDWKIPITASAWRQLTKFAMPEIHKWARKLNWQVIGREPFNERLELTQLSLKLKTGEAFALASDNSALIEGAHASRILYIFDESKEIPPDTWDSAEGAFSAGDCYWLAVSTPGEPVGRFYDIQSHKPGYEDWNVKHVSLEEAEESGRITRTWAESRKSQWGEQSAVYQNRVKGEFASSEADGVIPLSWIEAANDRWDDWFETKPELTFVAVGADIARSGEDKTVLGLRWGMVLTELRVTSKEDTMQTTGRVKGILDAHGGKAMVDVIGIGAGVVDRLREMKDKNDRKYNIVAFNASEHTDYTDKSGEMGFINCLTGSAKVMPIGNLNRVYRSRYEGTLYCIKTSCGDEFTATAHHQVLTIRGWAAVETLRPGDQLCNAATGDASNMSCVRPEVNNVPSKIGEVYTSANCLFTSERVQSGAVNFYGDRPVSDVNIVTINSNLLTVSPFTRKGIQDKQFIRTLLSQGSLLSNRFLSKSINIGNRKYRILTVLPNGDVLCGAVLPLRKSKMIEHDSVSLGKSSGLNGMLFQNSINSSFVDRESLGKLMNGLSTDILIDNGSLVNRLPSNSDGFFSIANGDRVFIQNPSDYTTINSEKLFNVMDGSSSLITPNEVISIDIINTSRHNSNLQVYTLETSTGMYCTTNTVHKNCRSASWWHLRELLDPAAESGIALPKDDMLTGDLVAPHWKVTSGGKIQVEAKEDIKERIGRSTDYGDAVVMAFFDNNVLSLQNWTDALKKHTK